MQFVADDGDVGPARRDARARRALHVLAEAVVLPDQVDLLQRRVALQHLDQRGQAHVGMRIEAEVPEAALLVGQSRVDRGIVEQQRARQRLALVVLVQRIDQHHRHR
jgi:hypothetical protein